MRVPFGQGSLIALMLYVPPVELIFAPQVSKLHMGPCVLAGAKLRDLTYGISQALVGVAHNLKDNKILQVP